MCVGDGRLFVVEQTGKIRIIKNNALLATPFLDLSGRGSRSPPVYDERGLLGLAFHPGFNDSSSPGFRKFYTYTSEPVAGAADFTVPKTGAFDHQSVIAEWQVSAGNPDVADPASRREVMRVDEPQSQSQWRQARLSSGRTLSLHFVRRRRRRERRRRWP